MYLPQVRLAVSGQKGMKGNEIMRKLIFSHYTFSLLKSFAEPQKAI